MQASKQSINKTYFIDTWDVVIEVVLKCSVEPYFTIFLAWFLPVMAYFIMVYHVIPSWDGLQVRPAHKWISCSNESIPLKAVLAAWHYTHIMTITVLDIVVTLLWWYLGYWYEKLVHQGNFWQSKSFLHCKKYMEISIKHR